MGFTSHRGFAARKAPSWHGSATILEALLLLVFLLAAAAFMTKTLALSYADADEGRQLSVATMAAANTAELFAADPSNADLAQRQVGELTVTCAVTPEKTKGGTLYQASINVYESAAALQEAQPLYTLSTSKYQSGVS